MDHNGCPRLLQLYHPEEDSRKILKAHHKSDPFNESATCIESDDSFQLGLLFLSTLKQLEMAMKILQNWSFKVLKH
ncbi:hypothetical protein SADUNF_Sadunf16G0196400 [Salix dunnii]|uniref:Uncharacterized protein n=1 Tax=Salix dunnii TaxID=1413687 RepID=A0A835MGZ5_9ROSI|nr:hypothetical protein SADUNF_Sadunf16G0196400 [Salix dunnii]